MMDDASHDPPPLGPLALDASRRGTSYPFAGFLIVLGWGLRQQFTAKRLVIWLVVAGGLGALGALLVTESAGSRVVSAGTSPYRLWSVIDLQTLQVLLPLTALLIVGPGYSKELRQRTLVYHLVRPVSRVTVYLARYAAGVLPAAIVIYFLFWPTLALSGVAVPASVYLATIITSLVGAAALGAVYFTLSALFRRGLIAGLIYTFVIEGMVGNLPGTMQKLSVRFHLRGLHHGLTDDAFMSISPRVARAIDSSTSTSGGPFSMVSFGETKWDSPEVATLVLLGIAAATLALGAYVIRRRDFALKD